jgi:hypothetical protein
VVALANVLVQSYPGHLPSYVDAAIELLDAAIAEAPSDLDRMARASLRLTHGSALLRVAERANDDKALARSTEELEQLRAESRDDGGSELYGVVRTNLGLALSLLAERSGRQSDWRRAVAVLREALDASGAADERQWRCSGRRSPGAPRPGCGRTGPACRTTSAPRFSTGPTAIGRRTSPRPSARTTRRERCGPGRRSRPTGR